MITEDYVSFETAKLLKEKGFSENTEHKIWYVIKQFSTGCHWNSCTYKVGDTTREYDDDCCIPMPTLQMAMKWLRKVYHWHIFAIPKWEDVECMPGEWEEKMVGYQYSIINIGEFNVKYEQPTITALSSESACEAAIKYCLEHLI